MAQMERWVEYVAEPMNADMDIIDPDFYDTLEQVRAQVPHLLARYPDALYVDVAKVFNVGNEDEGITDRRYAYIDRTYRDGRVVRLATPSGPSREPVEVQVTTRTLEWAARVAADATDRRAREAGRNRWDATDTAFYRALLLGPAHGIASMFAPYEIEMDPE